MDHDFWRERWKQNQIGFHQAIYNEYLQQYWDQLNLESGSQVFLPLCGKSLDSLWLRSQGYKVLGVEISELAVKDFFKENNLDAEKSQQGKFSQWKYEDITLLQGDFFDLSASDLKECRAVFDRASLIALPEEMRISYVKHLQKILPKQANILLITLEYDQSEMQGPPFAVLENEVFRHYQQHFSIKVLHSEDFLERAPEFKKKGLTALVEKVYLLNPL